MKLAALVLTIVSLTFAAKAAGDVSGKWAINGDIQGNAVNLDCTITQAADSTLTGQCQVNGTQTTEITGSVKDASIQFSFTVSGYTLNYSGTVDGESVSGGIEVAGATGTFSGTRAKA